jgi:5-methyltetrahydropteroyltriglutamate--homocysteine methyltransferase
MQRSTQRILATHVGSLPNLQSSAETAAAALDQSVQAVVKKQRELGIDIINEGAYTKGGDWLSFVELVSVASRSARDRRTSCH